jgi:lactam utilization protein B
VLDPTGAVARYVGVGAHPSYRWLDRRGRRSGPVRFSFALAVRR